MPDQSAQQASSDSNQDSARPGLRLRVTLPKPPPAAQLTWTDSKTGATVAEVQVTYEGGIPFFELNWLVNHAGKTTRRSCMLHRTSIRSELNRLRKQFPTADKNISAGTAPSPGGPSGDPAGASLAEQSTEIPASISPWLWIERTIFSVAEGERGRFEAWLRQPPRPDDPKNVQDGRRLLKFREIFGAGLRAETAAPRPSNRPSGSAARPESKKSEKERDRPADPPRGQRKANVTVPAAFAAKPPAPVPPVPVSYEIPALPLQDTLLPLADLRGYFLRERAALWWVSNQSDDLLALPYCDIQRLDYQIRTALRVIGPLRGRALLSDEVGLGKTIEAGLVLKEYLTRGMVKRFLIITVPSLVDQWEEELSQKFHLTVATTNRSQARQDPEKFWRENAAIVASLHTVKQAAHLAVAQTVNWDMLIVDEAHYLRNRTSQAWQAVNALPRQFLLLLTATPVQNSLEELYNLVTLLQPGQLPSPKEFRSRFIDPKKPHQPREPEELRRLLGQVMIRNTRANAGIDLPPRRAETVLFEPEESERCFWQKWEGELRLALAQLNPSQASLWGRLLLQTAGSSPAAWKEALKSFPNQTRAQAWTQEAPSEGSWKRKCQLLEPLTKGEGGVVIFTQYLQTQAAIAEQLRAAAVPTFVIHGQTPPPERQPITERFREQGGALLLTHSGTEGRNLQFSHRLVNFDLPWNPMEIEQRIGRLHRLGQKHPVRIYNLVQAGTLQEHLLQILQEKLNLFELVVGETGLILGERFSSDEFAEEVLRRWRESDGRVAEAMQSLGDELASARQQYGEIQQLDDTLFSKDYESL